MAGVSYTREIRAKAKEEGNGLICVGFVTVDGGSAEYYGTADSATVNEVALFMKKLMQGKAVRERAAEEGGK